MKILYLSPVTWSSFEQRPHKFVTWLHLKYGVEVIWLEPYLTRFPRASDVGAYLKRPDRVQKITPDWIQIISMQEFPIEPMPLSIWVQRLRWRNNIRLIERQFDGQQVAPVVVGKPSNLALILVKSISNSVLTYDAMDDFPEFQKGMSKWKTTNVEISIAKECEGVIVSAPSLKEKFRKINVEAFLVPNALDAKIFRATAVFEKLSLGRRQLGYVGTIGRWFDWGMVKSLARGLPNWDVVLRGPLYSKPPANLPSNVRIEPACTQLEAMKFMQQMDAGLINFRASLKLCDSVDPIKYYEYRAFGLPIISSKFGTMVGKNDSEVLLLDVNEYDEPDRFVPWLEAHEAQGPNFQFAEENDWNAKFTAGLEGYFNRILRIDT
jgi:hypothetical protein